MVPGDATLLEQVFLNLLESAARYPPPRTHVAISARRVDDGVEVAVADSGGGAPSGLEEKLFEKFERAAGTAGGMGLGLTISRRIVAAHRGRRSCSGGDPRGANVRLILPRRALPDI